MRVRMQNFFLASLYFILSGCSSQKSDEAPIAEEKFTAISLPLGMQPSVQYAPFYASEKMGFFQQVDIDITFEYGFVTDGVAQVASGERPFAIVSGEQVLLARAQGLPVLTVLSWYRDTPMGVLAFEEQNLLLPEDLAGKRIALPGRFSAEYLGLHVLLDTAKLNESDIALDLIGFNQVNALLSGETDVVVGDVASLSIPLFVKGAPVNIIPVADYRQLASLGLVTSEAILNENPDLVDRMVQAVTSGIRYTIAHPEDAFEFSKAFVDNLGYANAAPQMDILEASILFYQQEPLGYSNLEAWENTQALLLEMGLLTIPLDLSAAFSNDFIRE